MEGAPSDRAGEAVASAALPRERERPLESDPETFPESWLDGLETEEGPPTEIEPEVRSLPDRERDASERGGRRGGRKGAGVGGGTGKIGGLSPPGTLSSDHVTDRLPFDPVEDLLRLLPSDTFS